MVFKFTFIFGLIFNPLSYAGILDIDEVWNENSSPSIMSYYFTKKFESLPLSGEIHSSSKYWSGDYWALRNGNINYRWYSQNKTGFNLNSPKKDIAKRMTIPELAQLSPAEKYDLFTGRYDYPLTSEVSKISDKSAQSWEGICHGWSPASMNHNEPHPKLMLNPDGINIPFGSSDIKALISYYYAYGFISPDTHQMGKRCYKGPLNNRENDCGDDINAGAFHIVLANRIGIDGKGFIADLERFDQVWNHPITSYESTIMRTTAPHARSAAGATKVHHIRTAIKYVAGNGNDWHPVLRTPKQQYKSMTYEYEVDVDSQGDVIGGLWISKLRPDFLWLMARPREFKGTLKHLDQLLNDD